MTGYRWLLLDADNTLFDFDAAEEFALTRLLLHYGLPATAEVKTCYRGVNSALWAAFDKGEIGQEALVVERFRQFLAIQGVEGEAAEWNTFYLTALSNCPSLLPGAEGLCRKLSQRYILSLVTNGVPFVQRGRLERSPLEQYFGGRVFISGEMGCRKPEKVFFDRVLESLGATRRRGQALVIGDSLAADVRGAFNAQLDSVWLDRKGTNPGALKPTYRVTSFSDLEKLLLY